MCTDHICYEANILFDEGAQHSFITHTLANQLELETQVKEDIHLSSLGGQTSAVRHLSLGTVNVVTSSGEKNPTPCFSGREDSYTPTPPQFPESSVTIMGENAGSIQKIATTIYY